MSPHLLRTTLALALASAPALPQLPCLGQELAGTGTPGDLFGYDMAIWGDDVLISSLREDVEGGDSGGVYRYRVTSTGLALQERWPGSFFAGRAVAIDDGWAAYSDGNGVVYSYQRVGGTWNPVPVQAVGTAAFGSDLAIDAGPEPRLAVTDTMAATPAIRVFRLIGGTWFQEDTLTATSGNPPSFSTVAMLDDSTLFAGAPTEVVNGEERGVVYVFHRTGSNWDMVARLTQTGVAPGARIGHSIAAHGPYLVVGAPGTLTGILITYVRTGMTTWSFDENITVPSASGFGQRVAVSVNRMCAVSSNTGEVGFFTRQQGAWSFDGMLDLGTARADGLALGLDGAVASDYFNGGGAGRVVGAFFGGTDCDNDGTSDLCEIYAGTQTDVDGNGTPDDCECGDVSSFCSSNPNSSGLAAVIGGQGSTSIADNAFQLRVAGAAEDKPGLFYYGSTEIQVPFGDGFRCVGAGQTGLFRLNPPVVTTASGAALQPLDFTQAPAHGITPNNPRTFQFWFRDPMGPGGSGFNFTNGVSVTFCP